MVIRAQPGQGSCPGPRDSGHTQTEVTRTHTQKWRRAAGMSYGKPRLSCTLWSVCTIVTEPQWKLAESWFFTSMKYGSTEGLAVLRTWWQSLCIKGKLNFRLRLLWMAGDGFVYHFSRVWPSGVSAQKVKQPGQESDLNVHWERTG